MKLLLFISFLLIGFQSFSQNTKGTQGPTDTLLHKEFYSLPGSPTVLTYGYTNGNGYFFGTNFLDLDQDPLTPYQFGTQSFAQGFPIDSGISYYLLDILVRVGIKNKAQNSTGTPLILSVQYLDDSSTYNINTSSGTVSYTIHKPGTSLGSASIAWDNIKTGAGINYSVAHLNTPILIEKNFAVVVDLMDYYLNGDKIGLWVSAANGGSNIYGNEYTLWLYPDPLLWLQVNHIYSSVNRAIAIFPVVDDGTFGIADDAFLNGIKLGQSFPNPAQNQVTIEYEIEKASNIKIEFSDINGAIIYTEELGKKPMGIHNYKIDIENWNSGVYFYTLFTEKEHMTKRLIVN